MGLSIGPPGPGHPPQHTHTLSPSLLPGHPKPVSLDCCHPESGIHLTDLQASRIWAGHHHVCKHVRRVGRWGGAGTCTCRNPEACPVRPTINCAGCGAGATPDPHYLCCHLCRDSAMLMMTNSTGIPFVNLLPSPLIEAVLQYQTSPGGQVQHSCSPDGGRVGPGPHRRVPCRPVGRLPRGCAEVDGCRSWDLRGPCQGLCLMRRHGHMLQPSIDQACLPRAVTLPHPPLLSPPLLQMSTRPTVPALSCPSPHSFRWQGSYTRSLYSASRVQGASWQ